MAVPILFLGAYVPDDYARSWQRNTRASMPAAAQALEQQIIRGIEENTGEPVTICSTLPVFSFPRFCRRAFIPTTVFHHRPDAEDVSAGFCNIQYIKHLPCCGRELSRQVLRWVRSHRDEPVYIVVYSLQSRYQRILRRAKAINPRLRSCTVVADLPLYNGLEKHPRAGVEQMRRYQAAKIERCLDSSDTYALLTAPMAKYLHLRQPFTVIEGIATDRFPEPPLPREEKTVFYAGTLHERFGIRRLLEAFALLPGDYRLVLGGVGDCEAEIRRRAAADSRILFLGQIPREEVLSRLQQATVAVNPRPADEEFTRYSFPSKNLEVLSSGTPLVAYALSGIPEEYARYISYVQGDTPQELAAAIRRVCEMTAERRQEIGQRARDFVLQKKNSAAQTAPILRQLEQTTAIPDTRRVLLDMLHALVQRKPYVFPAGTNWNSLERLAARQSLTTMLGYVVQGTAQNGLPDVWQEHITELLYQRVLFSTRMFYEMDRVEEVLQQAAIPFVVMKGYVVRREYPMPELRSMGDIDILVHPEQQAEVSRLLQEHGFVATKTYGPVWDLQKDSFLLEVHAGLPIQPADTPGTVCLTDTWNYVHPVDGCKWEMDNTYHMFWLLAHLIKHLRHGGCGVRQVLDIAMVLKGGQPLDTTLLSRLLEEQQLIPFSCIIFSYCAQYFGTTVPEGFEETVEPELLEQLSDCLLSGGVFGRGSGTEDLFRFRQLENYPFHQRVFRTIAYYAGRLFPSLSFMKHSCPYLVRFPWLLPAAYIHRIGRLIFVRRGRWKTVRRTAVGGVRSVRQSKELYDRMGL